MRNVLIAAGLGWVLLSVTLEERAWAQVVTIPDAGLQEAVRAALGKPTGDITVADMEGLTNLDASRAVRGASAPLIGNLEGIQAARNLTRLVLSGSFSSPNLSTADLAPLAGLGQLRTLYLPFNQLTDVTLPEGLTGLTSLYLYNNQIAHLNLPAGLTNLASLYLYNNQLGALSIPSGLTSLATLNLDNNPLTTLALADGTSPLVTLSLGTTRVTDFSFLAGLTNLATLHLDSAGLTALNLPSGMASLRELDLRSNQLTDFGFLAGRSGLVTLDLSRNQLRNLDLPEGLIGLATLDLAYNELTNLTLTADLASLASLYVGNNPLATLVVPEPAAGAVSPTIDALRSQGIAVYLYPLETRLAAATPSLSGGFSFTLAGPPGVYRVQVTGDLSAWTDLGALTNSFGAAAFTDPTDPPAAAAFYRVDLVP